MVLNGFECLVHRSTTIMRCGLVEVGVALMEEVGHSGDIL